jgi:tetratricopeptide (TPR) repeat protein
MQNISPHDIDTLVTLFTKRRYTEAATLAQTMTVRCPLDAYGWKALGVVFKQMGRNADALAPMRKAVALAPGDVETHSNLGSILGALGHLEEAEASFRRALQIEPRFAEAHYQLGIALNYLGRLDEAAASFRRALHNKPDYAEAHNGLGAVLNELGQLDEAAASCRRALQINPNYAEAHVNLGVSLNRLGQLEEAAASARCALQIKPGNAEAHINLANTLKDLGRSDEALSHFRNALNVSPSLLAARYGIYLVLNRLVPQWHVPMMNEPRRNNAYFAALKSAITPDSDVFEIGTGSGLLAMMAAKLGANRVTTCEAVALIAKTAQRIVTDNGYEKSVKVISKRSADVEVGEDLPQKADILVSEIFSSELIGEYVLPSIEDAKRRLLKPEGRIIPAAGSIMIALFGGYDLGRNLKVEDSFGFKLQHFNSIVSDKQPIRRDDLDVEMLSDDTEAFRFDFENSTFFPSQNKMLRIPIRNSGRCYGVIQWMRLQMDKEVVFENHPSEKSSVSNWQRCAYVFPESIDVKPGQVIVVSASHNRKVPWFVFDGIESG